jgi:hypothetical protein
MYPHCVVQVFENGRLIPEIRPKSVKHQIKRAMAQKCSILGKHQIKKAVAD